MAPSPSLNNRALGKGMTLRLKRWLLPESSRNHQTYGALLRRYVSPCVRWLDASSTGQTFGENSDDFENRLRHVARQVIGVEINRRSRLKQHNVEDRVCAGLEALPFRDRSFDLVTYDIGFERRGNPRASLAELTRVLKPQAVLVVRSASTLNYEVLINRILRKIFLSRFAGKIGFLVKWRAVSDSSPSVRRANLTNELPRMLAELGMQTEQVRALSRAELFSRSFAPVALLELLLVRTTQAKAFQGLGSEVLIVGHMREIRPTTERLAA
jgi:SAM-dependent methyltransferase